MAWYATTPVQHDHVPPVKIRVNTPRVPNVPQFKGGITNSRKLLPALCSHSNNLFCNCQHIFSLIANIFSEVKLSRFIFIHILILFCISIII